MIENHILSDDVIGKVQAALANHEHWMAYNRSLYFLSPDDIFFFKTKSEAEEFSQNNMSDHDCFLLLKIQSVEDIFKHIYHGVELNTEMNLSHLKNTIMNEQNFEYLKDNIKYMGFGEKLSTELETKMKTGVPEFQMLASTEMNRKKFETTLNFRKSDSSEMYFFNSYSAVLERSNGEKVEQKFYLNNGKGVTAKEAYNLLEGRAVFKELQTKSNEPYKAWIQIDFDKRDKNNNYEMKQFHENYGYDLKAALMKYAIPALFDSEKERALLQSLQKGNVQSIVVEKDGKDMKAFIEANPQFKTVNLYDPAFKRVQKEHLGEYQVTNKGVREEQKSQELGESQKKTESKELKSELQKSKKRKSHKKGLSV